MRLPCRPGSVFFFFQAEDGIRDLVRSRGLGDVYKRQVLVAVGECANTGGVPSMRNGIPLKRCLEESFIRGQGTENAHIPDDPELPLLLNKVRPLHHVVKIDHFLPGCPPSADAFWRFLTELLLSLIHI